MAFSITVDTGGTFTDLALADDEKLLGVFKSPSHPDEPFSGVSASLLLAAEAQGLTLAEFLRDTRSFVYSTTYGTNAILVERTAKTAFVTTRGHRDILTYREGGKTNLYDYAEPYPKPYVPRSLTFELTERILADGSVHTPLDDDEVRRVLARIEEIGVEAIGVCLLWSPVNDAHEKRVGELIQELLPGVEYTLSHELNPILREYRRASSTVIDASIKPPMRRHLAQVSDQLRELGFEGDPVMVTHRSGGVLFFETMADRPLYTVDSGPALAPVAGSFYMAAESSSEDAIVVDAGGTSFDVSVIRGNEISFTGEKWLGPIWTGHLTGLPAVDTRSIGAGGGSIAWIDRGGLLHVGPQSAGARPGPVAYGLGGVRPTVTDAALVLGYVDPQYFLGGRFELDREAAERAIDRDVAQPLGMTVERAADAILRLAAENMHTFIRELTIDHGLDPRQCLLVSGGGASGFTIGLIARELGTPRVLIPRTAAGLSAVGGQYSDFIADFSQAMFTTTREFDFERVNATLARLSADIDDFFADLTSVTGTDPAQVVKEFVVEARYAHQVWELDVALGAATDFRSEADVRELEDAFHEAHEALFAVREPGQFVECVTWRGRGRLARNKPRMQDVLRTTGDAAAAHTRLAFFGGEPVPDCAIHLGRELAAGTRVAGPAIVEEPDTTIVVVPDCELEVTSSGNYLLHVGSGRDVPRSAAAAASASGRGSS